MKYKTPDFWYKKNAEPSFLETALTPISKIYKFGYRVHQNIKKPVKVEIPVLCIGNINAGGTGKTPTALALMALVQKLGKRRNPHFLIRGYGGGAVGPLLVNLEEHNAWHTGDEALILARQNPTIVSADRVAGARLAISKGADMVIMDDGLQNPNIHKDIKLIVINGEMGFGNEKMMPAGPLRQPLEEGLAMADGFILIGADKNGVTGMLPADKPVFHAFLKADPERLPSSDNKYLAFAGLGYPNKFFNFARDIIGLDIVETISLPDHYPYNTKDLESFKAKAKALDAVLLTTEKDFLRIPAAQQQDIVPLPVSLAWKDEQAIMAFLETKLDKLSS